MRRVYFSDVSFEFRRDNGQGSMMMKSRLMALAVATMLMMVAGVILIDDTDVDASVSTTGQVKVNYNTGNGWNSATVSAYNVYEAIAAVASDSTFSIETTNGSWSVSPYGYANPNENYGKLDKFNGSSTFYAYVYIKSDNTFSWEIAESSLGWYRPFQDYADTVMFPSGSSAGTANVALTTTPVAPGSDISTIPLTQIVTSGDDATNYRYAFTIKDTLNEVSVPSPTLVKNSQTQTTATHSLTDDDIRSDSGYTIYGYGSDAYLALKNAFTPDRVVGENDTYRLIIEPTYSYYQFYSWTDTILGIGTQDLSGMDDEGYYSQYKYWELTSNSTYLDFTLGFYSKLAGAPNDGDAFNLTYIISEKWYYPSES